MDVRAVVEREAKAVRGFLEKPIARATVAFRVFPAGGCGNASEMLGVWLKECGIDGAECVAGDRGDMSHAWLEVGDLVVDITSDQFEDGLGSVYVGRRGLFHESFVDQRRYTPSVPLSLGDLYSKMLNELRA